MPASSGMVSSSMSRWKRGTPLSILSVSVAQLVGMQVGNHAALRREVRGVAAVSAGQRRDVVRQQPLQIRGALASGDDDAAAVRPIDEGRAAASGGVCVEGDAWNHDAML